MLDILEEKNVGHSNKPNILIIGDTPSLHTLAWKLSSESTKFHLSVVSAYIQKENYWETEDGTVEKTIINGDIFDKIEKLKTSASYDILFISCLSIQLLTKYVKIASQFIEPDAFIIVDGVLGISFEVVINQVILNHPILTIFWNNDIKIMTAGSFKCKEDQNTLYLGFTSFPMNGIKEEHLTNLLNLIKTNYKLDSCPIHQILKSLKTKNDKLDIQACVEEPAQIKMKTAIWDHCFLNICFDMLMVIHEDFNYEHLLESISTKSLSEKILKELLRIARHTGISDSYESSASLEELSKSRKLEKILFEESTHLFLEYPITIYSAFNNYEDYSLIMVFQILHFASRLHCPRNGLLFLYSIYMRFTTIDRDSLFFNRPETFYVKFDKKRPVISTEPGAKRIPPDLLWGSQVEKDYNTVSKIPQPRELFKLFWDNQNADLNSSNNSSASSESFFDIQEMPGNFLREPVEPMELMENGFNAQTVEDVGDIPVRPSSEEKVMKTMVQGEIYDKEDEPKDDNVFDSLYSRGNSISSKTEDGMQSINTESEQLICAPLRSKNLIKKLAKKSNETKIANQRDIDNISTAKIYEDAFKIDESLKGPLLQNSKKKLMHGVRYQAPNPNDYEKSALDHKNVFYSANMGGLLRLTTDRYGDAASTKPPF